MKVRVLVRDAAKGASWKAKGAEVAVADLHGSEETLAGAFAGAEGAHVLLPPLMRDDFLEINARTARTLAGALRASRVPHTVLLSSIGAQHAAGTGAILSVHHAETELRAAGLDATRVVAARDGRYAGPVGILDRLFGSKSAPPPPVPATGSEPVAPPNLPARAVIATYVLADQVGTLRLESGLEVRFGRSACHGFEPVVGAHVIVEEIAPSPRGLRAKAVRLDVADEGYDRLMAERDAAAGLPPRTRDAAEAAATASQLALATVLLKEPLPEGVAGLQRWAERIGLAAAGVQAHAERDLELSVEGQHVLTYPGRAAFPSAGLDTRDLPERFAWGCSFIGLGTGVPGMDRLTRMKRLGAVDDWGASGRMRRLSKIVRVLAQHGTGVVVHRAGGLVVPAEDFVHLLGDLDHPDCRPFAAWIDVALTARGGEKAYASIGMDTFGLPDVTAPLMAEDLASCARAHEAVLFACYRMVRENRELAAGEMLEVPRGVRVGAWPVKLDTTEGSKRYVVEEDEDLRRLRAS